MQYVVQLVRIYLLKEPDVSLPYSQNPTLTFFCTLGSRNEVFHSWRAECTLICGLRIYNLRTFLYRGGNNSLARPESSYSDQILNFCKPLKKKTPNFVRPTRSPRQQIPPRGTKNDDLSIVFFQSGRAKDLSAPPVLKLKHYVE